MRFLQGMVIGGMLVALGMSMARAQNPALTPYQITVTAKCSGNMDTSATGQANYCWGTDGIFQSISGAAPSQAVAPALTINGTTKTLPASFTIAVAAPSITDTAPAPAVAVQ